MLRCAIRFCLWMLFCVSLISGRHALGTAYNWTGTANWNTPANWGGTVPGGGDSGDISIGTATANVVLAGSPTITVGGTGTLIHPAIGAATPLAGSITANSGGKIDFTGASLDLTPTIFEGGSSFTRSFSNGTFNVSSPLTFNSGTVTSTGIIGTTYESQYALNLIGAISGSGDLLINPTLATHKNALRINSSVANAYTGNVTIQGIASAPGVLALQGTGPLKNAASITINPNGILRLNAASDPLKSGITVAVPLGAKMEWGGSTTYSYAPANIPTIAFGNGSTFGRGDANAILVGTEKISIGSGVTVTADSIKGTTYETQYALTWAGPLSGNGTLNITPATASDKSTFRLAPTSANAFNGTVNINGSPTVLGVLALSGSGALSSVSALNLNANGILRFNNSVDALPAGFGVAVPNGGRVEWSLNSSYTSAPPVLTFATGSTLGRTDANSISSAAESIVIPSLNTALATNIAGTVYENQYALTLAGAISGSGTLRVEPAANVSQKGTLRLNPTSPNSFNGTVEIGGNSTVLGYLSLAGNGALANVSNLSIEQYGVLRFNNANNPLPSAFTVNVPNGARIEWLGTSTYSVTRPTLLFQNGSTFGRVDANGISTAPENISLAPGASVLATNFAGTVLQQQYGITYTGTLTGDSTTTLRVKPSTGVGQLSVMTINTATANSGFSGNVNVESASSTYRGVLILNGTGPLGAAKVNIDPLSIVTVGTNGALNNVTSVNLQNTGALRFRVTGGSTLNNTTLTGTGLIRSEATVAVNQDQPNNYALQSLTLTNTTLSPGNSAGTLSFEATTLTLGSGSVYVAELGLTPDLIAVTGNLVLSAGTTLSLDNLAGLVPGTYNIATTTGTVTGTFGSIINNLDSDYLLMGVTYGSNFIAVNVQFAPIPEPGTGMLAACGALSIFVARRRKSARATQTSRG